MDLPTKCHFIGIGGIGMSALAKLMLGRKASTSGSDQKDSSSLEELKKMGIAVKIGHHSSSITSDMTVVVSSDIREDNVELVEAKRLGCTVLHRSELLQHLMATRKSLAVTGSHGKTTTSALLSYVLHTAGMAPGVMVGGIVQNFSSNASDGDGEYFVTEADESDGSFLRYFPYGAIVTNIDSDHLAHYLTRKNLDEAFRTFCTQVQEHLFWCADDETLSSFNLTGVSYGFSERADLHILSSSQVGWKSLFSLSFRGKIYSDIELALMGPHNVLNGTAVFGLALSLGIPEDAIRKAFTEFRGVKRRGDKKGEAHGIAVYDDYAHHPTEIKTTLKGFRQAVREKRLIVIFEPHRYSRLRYCMEEFRGVFDEADIAIVTDIYTAGESPVPGVTIQRLMQISGGTYVPRGELLAHMQEILRPHDVVVTMGAGGITSFGPELLQRPPKKWKVALIRGGESVEHEISLISARYVEQSLSKELYEVEVFTLSKEGLWEGKSRIPPAALASCDIAFPVLHGPRGEDGTIQGMFEMLDLPYVGCSHSASAIAMDKALTKSLCSLEGIQTPRSLTIAMRDWRDRPVDFLKNIEENFSLPVFVKACHLGSSIGVEKVVSFDQLAVAIAGVFRYDHKLIVEQGIYGREIEFAVLGNTHIEAFPPGEILTGGEFYDYEAKYSQKGMKTTIHPELTQEAIQAGIRLAERAFRAIGGEGMARIDFFYDESGNYWLNEINPIPGFTPISMYPQLLEAAGISGPELVDRLLILALQRQRRGGALAHALAN